MLSRSILAFLLRSKHLLISWLQSTNYSDFGNQENKVYYCVCFPFYLPWSEYAVILIFFFFLCWALSQLFQSPLSPSTRDSFVPLCFLPYGWCHLHIWGYWYFSREILIPACDSSSPAFCMMYSAYKLNKQGDDIQPWHTPFPILYQSVGSISCSNCCFLTCIQLSQEAGDIMWHSHILKNFPQFVVIHTVEAFSIVKEAELDVFLELSCFFYDPTDVGNLICGFSAFSKSSLNIWRFLVHILLSLAWRILSITLLACEISAIVQ